MTTVSAARLVATLPLAMLSVAMLWQVASHGLTPLLAQEPDRAALELFEKRIRPALVQHCYECHRADVAEGKLALDSRDGLRRGGESGPAIVPGDPDRSLLIRSLRHADPKLKMPKDAPRLADNVI
ncbi:MAG TPA: hypothetical protein PLV92_11185, partial [Pirellulaceae bacterium]|nr:hypothetical protein [Pirellulaceae bacterium]